MPPETGLPEGYSVQRFPHIDSTNAEALRQVAQGAAGRLWVRADRQTAGRGRSGRRWRSDEGNLYASVLLRPACRLETAVQLGFVAGLAAFEAVSALSGGIGGELRLKWPNDLLLGGKKLAGILLESVSGANGEPVVAAGTGINLTSHPGDAAFPATDLAAHGVAATTDAAFAELARATARWLDAWDNGAGWAQVREAWAARGLPSRSPIRVHAGKGVIEGRIAGLDARGALLIDTGGPAPELVTAGDVFLL